MRNRASARGKESKGSPINPLSHGEFSLKRYSLWFFIIIAGIIVCLNNRSALKYPSFSQGEVKRFSLDNGMAIVVKENKGPGLVSLFLAVRAGSAQEGALSGSGLAHFVEHLVFKGTNQRRVGEIFKEIESCGGKINAFTSFDYTGYTIIVPSEFSAVALEVLADLAANASFDPDQLAKEKEVVLQEIRLSNDDPQRHASHLLWQTAYSQHPYQEPILGKEYLFKQLTRENILEFYQANYQPDNMVLAVVGDIDANSVLPLAQELFAKKPYQKTSTVKNIVEPGQGQLRQYEEEFTAGLSYLLLGFHSVALTDQDCPALDVLAAILGEGKSSRLYKLICEKKRLAYSLEAVNYTPQEPGLLIISSLLEESERQGALSLILGQIERLKRWGVGRSELQKAKNKIIGDIIFAQQTLESQAQDLALNEALTADHRFTEEYIRKIKQVNPHQVRQAANKYLDKNNLSIISLLPRGLNAGNAVDLKQLNRPLELGVENLSPPDPKNTSGIERYALSNGLTLLIKEEHALPIVAVKAVFSGGLRAENEKNNGLSNLTALMLEKGTRSLSAEEIAALVDAHGANLDSFSGNNSLGLGLNLLSRDFDWLLKLLADLIINPVFPEKEFKKERQKVLASLKAEDDDIFASGSRLLKKTIFQKHPYQFVISGSEKSITQMKKQDLIAFQRKFCVGRNMVLAVFGDINSAEVLKKVEKYFARLPLGEPARFEPKEEPKTQALRTAAKPLLKEQSLVMFGFQGAAIYQPDRYALEVLCEILSQNSGRLFSRIREKQGLAYTLGAYPVFGVDTGYLVIYIATRAEGVTAVQEEVRQQLALLQQELVGQEELAQAKRALTGSKLISRQTLSSQALESALDQLYGLGCDYYLTYTEKINQVDALAIQRCAQKYFPLDAGAQVVVGPERVN